MNESLTPQELLYMYLDGECSPEQVDILFSAMATNPELQREFDEAVAFQQKLEEDKSKSVIPFNVTQSVFQKIGASIIPSSEIVSSATVATTNVVSNTVFQSIWSFITTNSVSIGISAALTLITGIEYSHKNIDSVQNATKTSENLPYATSSKSKDVSSSKITKETLKETTVGNNEVPSESKSSVQRNTIQSTAIESRNNGSSNKSKNSLGSSKQQQPAFTILTPNANDITESTIPQTTVPSVLVFPSLRNEYKEDDRAVVESLQQLPLNKRSTLIPVIEPLMLSIQLRSMNGISNFPDRNVSETFANNLGTVVLIALNKNHSIGLEISQETFPHYALETQRIQNFTTAPLFVPKETIMWTGATYQYSFDAMESVGSISPFVRTTLGASSVGGLSKTILGIQVPITNSVFSTLGLEGSMFLINNASTINASQKIGITYSLGWNFK
jgi:hypothetical protein